MGPFREKNLKSCWIHLINLSHPSLSWICEDMFGFLNQPSYKNSFLGHCPEGGLALFGISFWAWKRLLMFLCLEATLIQNYDPTTNTQSYWHKTMKYFNWHFQQIEYVGVHFFYKLIWFLLVQVCEALWDLLRSLWNFLDGFSGWRRNINWSGNLKRLNARRLNRINRSCHWSASVTLDSE